MAEKRGGSRQALVDEVFRRCMANDWRTRRRIVNVIQAEISNRKLDIDFREESILGWNPLPYDLHVMISRVASREEDDPEDQGSRRPFFPAYDEPRRFVSLERIEALTKRADQGEISADELSSLLAMYADLQKIRDHFEEKKKTINRRLTEVIDQIFIIETTKMDLADSIQEAVDGEEG